MARYLKPLRLLAIVSTLLLTCVVAILWHRSTSTVDSLQLVARGWRYNVQSIEGMLQLRRHDTKAESWLVIRAQPLKNHKDGKEHGILLYEVSHWVVAVPFALVSIGLIVWIVRRKRVAIAIKPVGNAVLTERLRYLEADNEGKQILIDDLEERLIENKIALADSNLDRPSR